MRRYILLLLFIGFAFWSCEEVDTEAPEVSIITPDEGQDVHEYFTIVVQAKDASGINRVEYFIDGELKFTDSETPYEYRWNTLEKEDVYVEIKVVAYDNSDNKSEAWVTVKIDNEGAIPTAVHVKSVEYTITEMQVIWDESIDGDFSEYKLLYATEVLAVKDTLAIYTEKSNTSHAIAEFDPLIENWFWIQVTDTLGLTNIGEGMSNDLDSQPAPINVTNISYNLESMTITWDEYSQNNGRTTRMNLQTGSTVANDFAFYELLQSDSEYGDYSSIATITEQWITSHSISEFDPTINNWFKVKVTDFWNLTSTGDASTNEIDNPPEDVSVTEVNYDTTPQMIITWEDSDDWDFLSYELLQAVGWEDEPSDDDYTPVVVILEQETTSYTITEFDPNFVNWFKIKTTDHWGLTSIGNADKHQYNRSPEPVAITSVTYDFDLMTITWYQSDAEDFASYALMRSDNWNGEYDTLTVIDDISVTSFQINDFDPTVENWFKIMISDYWGKTNTCCEMTNDIEPPPSAPELNISLTGNDSLFIYWTNSDTGPFSYRLFESQTENDINNNFTNTWDLSDTSITILSPSVGVWYYMVVVEDYWGQVRESNTYAITLCNEGEVGLWGECYSIETTISLDLSQNGLTGFIPPEIGNLVNLTNLDLSQNGLRSSIPPEIGNLVNLTNLDLSENILNDFIPPEIGNLVNLTNLNLFWCRALTGSIPPEIGNLTNLSYLKFSKNQLTGSIPSEIGNLTNLTYLDLWNNQLTGSIPSEIGNLINLTKLYLSNNQLTGSIPPEIGNLTNLTSLSLGENQLTGSIPPEIGNLTNLTGLSFSHNQLTGSIPPEIGNLTAIYWYFLLNDNQLSGVVPESICNINIEWDGNNGSLRNNALCPPYPAPCLNNMPVGMLGQNIDDC